MKYVLVFITFYFFSGSFLIAQEKFVSFELKGTINQKSGRLTVEHFLSDRSLQLSATSFPVVNGAFTISGQVSYPHMVRVGFRNATTDLQSLPFFIDTGKQSIQLKMKDDEIHVANYSGISNIEYFKEFVPLFAASAKQLQESNWQLDSLYQRTNTVHTLAKIDSLTKVQKEINRRNQSILRNYVLRHNRSYIAFWTTATALFENYDTANAITFEKFDTTILKTYAGTSLSKILPYAASTIEGAKFPLAEIKSLAVYHKNNLDTFKYLLIDFWYSSCGPCIATFSSLRSMYSKYHPKGFNIAGVSIDKASGKQEWENAIVKFKLAWPQFWDPAQQTVKKFLINFFPTTILLDATGRVVLKNADVPEIERFLRSNLK